ncbi:hypothetical protein ACRALDRAFT_209966 [Sodiomyces alcalophilus JCM 7366]|uniref:uncharacterized protein n=1 Tax=Sodiomyces alcalophilus JCM 7366 TaxID=591952 RepID=UPI0039B66244
MGSFPFPAILFGSSNFAAWISSQDLCSWAEQTKGEGAKCQIGCSTTDHATLAITGNRNGNIISIIRGSLEQARHRFRSMSPSPILLRRILLVFTTTVTRQQCDHLQSRGRPHGAGIWTMSRPNMRFEQNVLKIAFRPKVLLMAPDGCLSCAWPRSCHVTSAAKSQTSLRYILSTNRIITKSRTPIYHCQYPAIPCHFIPFVLRRHRGITPVNSSLPFIVTLPVYGKRIKSKSPGVDMSPRLSDS